MFDPRVQIPDWLECVGAGWRPILIRLHERLRREVPEYRVDQVKEKFGGLRVYLDPATGPAWDAVADAENTAAVTCEFCGRPGRLRQDRPWLKTLCDSCNDERNREYERRWQRT